MQDRKISVTAPNFHAYVPLFYAPPNLRESVTISLVALNEGEAKFVKNLKVIVESITLDFLKEKKIYLMRNLSRGKGISFFEDYSFDPDFILWVEDSNRQDILFIDPKWLVNFDNKVTSKVDLHRRIKDTEKMIQKKHPNLFLHSYIWSVTQPKDIGSDSIMTHEDYSEKGIFLASGEDIAMSNLLQHALGAIP